MIVLCFVYDVANVLIFFMCSDTSSDLDETQSLAESDDRTASVDTSAENSELNETISDDMSPGIAKPRVPQLQVNVLQLLVCRISHLSLTK